MKRKALWGCFFPHSKGGLRPKSGKNHWGLSPAVTGLFFALISKVPLMELQTTPIQGSAGLRICPS